jgi:sugar phosphate permease
MILIGATLAGIGYFLLSSVNSFLTFFLVYVFVISMGFNAGFFHPMTAAITNWFIKRRGTAISILLAAGSFGGMVMAPTLSYFVLNYSWRTAAIFAGILILAISLPLATFIHRSPEERGLLPDGRLPQNENPDQPKTYYKSTSDEIQFTVKEAVKTFAYWLLTLAISLRILVTVALSAHLVPILVWKGMSEATAAYLVSLFGFTCILVMLTLGWIGDRWSKSLLCSLAMLATSFCLFALVFYQAGFSLYLLPVGLAITLGTAPLNWSLIGDFFGRRYWATLRGIMGVFNGIATFLSPIYAGWLYDHTESYTTVLISFSILLLMGAFTFVILRKPTQKITNASNI